MKKLAILIVIALISVPLTALAAQAPVSGTIRDRLNHRQQVESPAEASEGNEPLYDDPLINIAMELIFNMHELAGDEAYWAHRDLESVEHITNLASTDPTDLRSIHRIHLSDELGETRMRINKDNTNAAYKRMQVELASELFILSNIICGPASMDEASALHWTEAYTAPENFEPCCWIVNCGGALYGINFMQGNDNIMIVSIDVLWLRDSMSIEQRLTNFTTGYGMPDAELIWVPAE